ncbi:cupin domain-containing protein [Loktanella sp. SALINAS62]|uniref:(R)-mandelonitrile lyase n=1 Tax=Loktanella sp. SALINAS62 TaxID=2706124 RepID=UPI001B8D4D36|nr:cupin domain-containing protein [Loktanella sp. SALINAS62]MBS1303964.1 cupin domain-containing protein [Loktanella sp. SALINAS62]
MSITALNALPVTPAPADYFTGDVSLRRMFAAEGESRLSGLQVTFAPGARTAWHTHPAGQVLIVTEGAGRIQIEDGPIQPVVAGDIVRFPAGVRHWHGAAPDVAMTHLALQEDIDGSAVTWLDHVTDAEYGG